jgi:hypothetical protein
MRRFITFALAACAVAFASVAQAQAGRNINVSLRAYDVTIKLDTIATWSRILATPPETFHAIRNVLDSLVIPQDRVDSARGLISNPSFKFRRKLAGKPAVWAFRCGQGITGDYAQSARIEVAYAVFVDGTDVANESKLGLAFIGSAETVEGASKPPMPCESTGQLELYIIKMAQLRALNPLVKR